MTFMGHKQVLWLQYGEIVWNMGDGTSQGTTVVVICNSFVGQRGPSRGIKGHIKGPMRSKTSFFGHKWVWWLQSGGTASIKVGYSKGIAQAIYWNNFLCTKGWLWVIRCSKELKVTTKGSFEVHTPPNVHCWLVKWFHCITLVLLWLVFPIVLHCSTSLEPPDLF